MSTWHAPRCALLMNSKGQLPVCMHLCTVYHLLPQEVDVLRDGATLLQDRVHHLHWVLLTKGAGFVELKGTAGGKAFNQASWGFFRCYRRIVFRRQRGRHDRVTVSDLNDFNIPFELEKQHTNNARWRKKCLFGNGNVNIKHKQTQFHLKSALLTAPLNKIQGCFCLHLVRRSWGVCDDLGILRGDITNDDILRHLCAVRQTADSINRTLWHRLVRLNWKDHLD